MFRLVAIAPLLLVAASVLAAGERVIHVRCPTNCTVSFQAALFSTASHVVLYPPASGAPAFLGSPEHSTTLVANGTNMLVEFAEGLEFVGYLNYTTNYSAALVTLVTHGAENLTFRSAGSGNTVLRHISFFASGVGVCLERLSFVDPGWDGLYARGIVGLTMKDCVFDRPYRNGLSVIDAVNVLAENCTFSNSLPNGTGRVSPMAGVDLEPNRYSERLHNITFRRCRAINNSGAGFQIFPAALNASSLPVAITFEDCHVEGVGLKPLMAPMVPDGYYFNAFGGRGAPGFIRVVGGTVSGTSSFGAAVYAHGINDPHVTFDSVLFDHVAVSPATFDPNENFTNGPLVVAALGSTLNQNSLGGVTFRNVVVNDGRARPVLVVDGRGSTSVAGIEGHITLHDAHNAVGCTIAAGGWRGGEPVDKKALAALVANVSLDCRPDEVKILV